MITRLWNKFLDSLAYQVMKRMSEQQTLNEWRRRNRQTLTRERAIAKLLNEEFNEMSMYSNNRGQ